LVMRGCMVLPLLSPQSRRERLKRMTRWNNMAHEGFAKVAKKTSPQLAAWIGRKLYGKEKFQKAAASGEKLSERQRLPKFRGKGLPKFKGTG
jgi:hypothetical protein